MTAEQKPGIIICLNTVQQGERSDRLMAVIPVRPEKIDLGYPEKARDRLSFLNWKSGLSRLSLVGISLAVSSDGGVRLFEGLAYQDFGKITMGAAELTTGLISAIVGYRRFLKRINNLYDVQEALDSKIKTGLVQSLDNPTHPIYYKVRKES